MAQKTISIGFKVDDGQGGFKRITADASELRKVMQGTLAPASALKKNLTDVGAASRGWDAMTSAMNSLMSALSSTVDAYNVQLEAETKLETVMRQRMAATEESIQSIKDLCAAQQQLGVIGDEIQLAGAQQIATFLTQQDALETLIPAMNNLVAQQKGLNATSGDAVNIANMLGKAMQGQTSALRRVGITFSEAEEQAVKYGTEQERAAALAKIITNNVGDMNAELAKTSAGQMKQLSNTMGDLQEKIGRVAKNLMPAITMLNQMTMAGANISKITMAFNALRGTVVKSVAAFREADVQLKVFGKTITATTAASKTFAVAFKASMLAVKTALITTGIGAAIWAIGEGVGFLTRQLNGAKDAANGAAGSIESLKEQEANYNKLLTDTQAQLTLHIAELKNFNGTKEEERKKVEELNNIYGEQMGTMSTLSQWYETLTTNSELYARQIVLQAKAQKLAEDIANSERLAEARKQNTPKQSSVSMNGQLVPLPKMGEESTPDWSPNISKAVADMSEAIQKKQEETLAGYIREMGENSAKMRGNASKAGGRTPGTNASGAIGSKNTTPAPEGSVADFEKQIQEIEAKIKIEPDPENVTKLELQKAEIQSRLDAFIASVDIRLKYEKDFERIKEEMEKDPIDLVANLEVNVDADSLDSALQDIPRATGEGVKSTKSLANNLQGLGAVAGSVGDAFSSMGEAFEAPELDVAGIIAGSIANIASGAGSAIAQSSSMGPWAWAAFAAAATAQTVAMIAQIKKATAFASGGVVSGPTLALVGEYAGAGNNPEVIAPLDKLRDMIGNPAGAQAVAVTGKLRVKGSELEIALENEKRLKGFSKH